MRDYFGFLNAMSPPQRTTYLAHSTGAIVPTPYFIPHVFD
jgi:hypothetical protein